LSIDRCRNEKNINSIKEHKDIVKPKFSVNIYKMKNSTDYKQLTTDTTENNKLKSKLISRF